MPSVHRLIVARYNEPSLEPVPGWETLVVQKGVDIPNEGREASSYFWAMHRLYPDIRPDDVLAFVQGNPFDHCPDLLAELEKPTEGYRPLGNWTVVCDLDGHPHHGGLDLAPVYRKWVGGEPPSQLTFTAGAQFVVPGRLILRRPDNFWRNMVKRMTGNGPWQMERLWPYLFKEDE